MEEQYEVSSPSASALIESLRSVGYTMPSALADLVDNSVTAKAKCVELHFVWDGQQSSIRILDDGVGMDEEALVRAMRPGSTSPLETRRADDLGRFGLGLKTASFSQARKLTVWSKVRSGAVVGRCWDLDYVAKHNEWRLLKCVRLPVMKELDALAGRSSGTLVVWEVLDRVVDQSSASSAEAHRRFLRLIEDVRCHLAMTFHRFLQGTARSRHLPLRISINGAGTEHLIQPWNPFHLAGGPASKETPREQIRFAGSVVEVRGYVLPHKDRLTQEQLERGAGPMGWIPQQGFYVYRNDRVLLAGDWLRLGRERPWTKEEHFKLARLSLDIPNTTDHLWSLDIKKSTAKAPASIKERLTELAESVRLDARRVFAHRGEYGTRATSSDVVAVHPWKSKKRGGNIFYEINRTHPLVNQVLDRVGIMRMEVESVLRLAEETVPVQRIWLDTADGGADHSRPYEGVDQAVLEADIRRAADYLKVSIRNPENLLGYLQAVEPFSRYPELVAAVLSKGS